MEQRIRRLLDEDEIRKVLLRYWRGIDRGDAELMSAAFHPDAIDDHGSMQLLGRDIGERFASWARDGLSHRSGQVPQHFQGNVLIDVEGDIAFAESYFISYSVVEQSDKEYARVRAGRTIDRFERRDGIWKIAFRIVVDDWSRFGEVAPLLPENKKLRHGDVAPKDPVYAIRTGALDEREAMLRRSLLAS